MSYTRHQCQEKSQLKIRWRSCFVACPDGWPSSNKGTGPIRGSHFKLYSKKCRHLHMRKYFLRGLLKLASSRIGQRSSMQSLMMNRSPRRCSLILSTPISALRQSKLPSNSISSPPSVKGAKHFKRSLYVAVPPNAACGSSQII